jgi:hypothetical protein
LRQAIKPKDSLAQVVSLCLTAWRTLVEDKSFEVLAPPEALTLSLDGRTLEAALLDRTVTGPVHYRHLQVANLKP